MADIFWIYQHQFFHYLTPKQKKVGIYRKHIQYFMEQLKKGEITNFEMNDRHYSCVKITKGNEVQKIPTDTGWVELISHLKKTLSAIDNPYITGVEGFFILESSVDDEPEKILKLYKERDKAEKFIRALKEGIELRPVRHWSK